MGDTREIRDENGHDEGTERREEELGAQIVYEDTAKKRRENHESGKAEREPADDS